MLPIILLSIGLNAPIHFLVVYYKYQKRVGKFRGIISTMKHSGFPITMTSITTVAGLLTFSFSDIAPIANLVNFIIIGILAILVFTLFTLPAFLSILQVVEGAEKGEANYWLGNLRSSETIVLLRLSNWTVEAESCLPNASNLFCKDAPA